MCYPVWGIVHIKETLLLVRKRSPLIGSEFPHHLNVYLYARFRITLYKMRVNGVLGLLLYRKWVLKRHTWNTTLVPAWPKNKNNIASCTNFILMKAWCLPHHNITVQCFTSRHTAVAGNVPKFTRLLRCTSPNSIASCAVQY